MPAPSTKIKLPQAPPVKAPPVEPQPGMDNLQTFRYEELQAQQLARDEQAAEAEVARLEMRLVTATIANRVPGTERSEMSLRPPSLSSSSLAERVAIGGGGGGGGGREPHHSRLDSLDSSPASTLRTETSAGTLRQDGFDPLRRLGLLPRDGADADYVDSAASSSRTTLLGDDSRPPSSRMTSAPPTDRSAAGASSAYGLSDVAFGHQQQQQQHLLRSIEDEFGALLAPSASALAYAPSAAPMSASGVVHLNDGTSYTTLGARAHDLDPFRSLLPAGTGCGCGLLDAARWHELSSTARGAPLGCRF